jgi:hypothetical protein
MVEASNGIAPSTKMVLTYEDLIGIEGGPLEQYTFRGNSVYDPDYTSTGHQPRYFDTYAAIYGKYRVLASRITVDLINSSATSGVSFVILPHTDVITLTTFQEMAELPKAKVSLIVPIASRYAQRMTHAGTTAHVCGLREKEVLDQDWASTVGTNPVQIWYWNIGVATVDGVTDNDVSLRVRLEYEVVFFERNDPGVSVYRKSGEPTDQQNLPKPTNSTTCPISYVYSDQAERTAVSPSEGGVFRPVNSSARRHPRPPQ